MTESTQRGIIVPSPGQMVANGVALLALLRQLGLSVDAAIGGLGAVATLSPETLAALEAFDAETGLADAVVEALIESELTGTRDALNDAIDARTRTGKPPVGQDELVVRVEDYGAAGDGITNDRWPLQLAINAAQGRDVVLQQGKVYRCEATLVMPTTGGVSLRSDGVEPAVIYRPNQSGNIIEFKANSTPVRSTTLTASIGVGSRDWPVANAAGVEPGMICEVISSASWYFDPRPETTDTRKSELHRVRAVVGNTVYMDDPCNDGYNVSNETVTLNFYRPIKVRMQNVTLRAELPTPDTTTQAMIGAVIERADEPELINVNTEGCARAGIMVFDSYHPKVYGGYSRSSNNYFNGYGVDIVGCSHAHVIGRVGIECRRVVDVSGFNVISRQTLVERCIALGGGKNSRDEFYGWDDAGVLAADQYGFGTHGAADQTTYRNNVCIDIKRPFHTRGRDEVLEGNQVYGRTYGGVVQVQYGTNLTIRGNRVAMLHWSYKHSQSHEGAASINTKRADCFVRIYSEYNANPPTGTARGRLHIVNNETDVRDDFILLDGMVPFGSTLIMGNHARFGPISGSDPACLIRWQGGTPPNFDKSAWHIGPNVIHRDTGGGDLLLVKDIDLSGAKVITWGTLS